jgi:hypothetical protein
MTVQCPACLTDNPATATICTACGFPLETEQSGLAPTQVDLLHLPPSTLLNQRYKIEKTLGQGGFGITYQATDMTCGEARAIKELMPEMSARIGTKLKWSSQITPQQRQAQIQEFKQEAQNLAAIINSKFDRSRS